MTKMQILEEALRLDARERMELVEALENSVEGPPSIPDWQWSILEECLAEADAHPERGQSWDEVRRSIENRPRRVAAG